jgi:hypothetical protein
VLSKRQTTSGVPQIAADFLQCNNLSRCAAR